MKTTNKKITDILNEVLTAELTAINQYFLHAEICKDWGYVVLHEMTYKQSIDEMKHAQKLIQRILYLKGIPNVQRLGKIHIGETIHEQFKLDLDVEKEAISRLNSGIQTCRDEGDNGTGELLKEILTSEEEHIHWLESQLHLIDQVGEQNYLAQQIRKE